MIYFFVFVCLYYTKESPFHWISVVSHVSVSFLLLTNYALLHEASHGNYHKDKLLNDFGGVLSGFLFPISYTLVRVTHSKHHACNRTQYESFDLISPKDNRLIKFLQWYSILLGLFWPSAILGNLLVAIFPNARHWKLFQNRMSTKLMLEDLQTSDIPKIRLETFINLVGWGLILSSGFLNPYGIGILYGSFAFNWSTRQYITHAFSERKVVEGAFNLTTSSWHEKILLYGNWDREHHEFPECPWIFLPTLGKRRNVSRMYGKQYMRMWLGPVSSEEPPPLPLPVHRQF
ncbi:fatty acid desaturase [Leptospira kemamanensis]|uniref:fatty acid desaturase n=1 Tax=Leptospira kemamanensis TaxID=2484942 RepID=UPI00142D76A1|nr:fatty acid desaturase [Leptospira kemamanensis]